MTPRNQTDAILSAIAQRHGMTLAKLVEQDKAWAWTQLRHQVWLEASLELPDWSTTQLGKRLNRDHSTIVYGRQKAASIRYDLPPKSKWPVIQAAALAAIEVEKAA